jgi:hypothetical protein
MLELGRTVSYRDAELDKTVLLEEMSLEELVMFRVTIIREDRNTVKWFNELKYARAHYAEVR